MTPDDGFPIRPLRDWVCIEPLEYRHPVLAVVGIRLTKGIVRAVGPGRRLKRKVRFLKNPDRVEDGYTWFEDGLETGKIRPVSVQIGDCVEYAASDRRRGGTKFLFDGVEYIMVPEQSIIALDPHADPSDGMLEHKAAGFDKQGRFIAE